ncbi:MAG: NDP-hexose 2,3-dehydratase family protein [Pseudomonadota bacterium]
MTDQLVAPGSLQYFESWRRSLLEQSFFTCSPIAFSESSQWMFEDGVLRHRTGGFFSLAGLRSDSRRPELNGCEQLIILQPETAINGFLARRRREVGEILFQGRIEPGNVEVLQLAPTVQSTEANYKQLHGGKPTPFIEWFLGERATATPVYDQLQSEEASRYYGKYNRNVVMLMRPASDAPPLPNTFHWFNLSDIQQFAVSSNILNTDARSVLSGMPWEILASSKGPFAGATPNTFRASLFNSYRATAEDDLSSDLDQMAWLTRLRVRSSPRHRVIRIDELSNWIVDEYEIRENKKKYGFRAMQFKVAAEGREVASWDQPLIKSDGVGRLSLICQQQATSRGSVLRFLIKASHEIGFLEGVQFAASVTIAPGQESTNEPVEVELCEIIQQESKSSTLQRCRQSEEGGRFYHDENDYELVMLDSEVTIELDRCDPEIYRWMTLAQIRRLMPIPGTFSMEFRGVLALLLHYL